MNFKLSYHSPITRTLVTLANNEIIVKKIPTYQRILKYITNATTLVNGLRREGFLLNLKVKKILRRTCNICPEETFNLNGFFCIIAQVFTHLRLLCHDYFFTFQRRKLFDGSKKINDKF